MKKIINDFYNLFPNKIYNKNNETYFYINDKKFYLIQVKTQEIDKLIEISNELYKKNIKSNTFIFNKNNNFLTKINKKNYCILKVNEYEELEISLKDIIYFDRSITKENQHFKTEMINKWKNKIDKLETQIIEYNKEYPIIKKSVNYYIGLAENAISLAYNTSIENTKLYLSHVRLSKKINAKAIYNPLNYIEDYIIRDISSYIKINFFYKNNNTLNELEEIIESHFLSPDELKLLYIRMLYPDYYFDEIINIIKNKKEEKRLNNIINKINKYEYLLDDLYNLIIKYTNIIKLDWLH